MVSHNIHETAVIYKNHDTWPREYHDSKGDMTLFQKCHNSELFYMRNSSNHWDRDRGYYTTFTRGYCFPHHPRFEHGYIDMTQRWQHLWKLLKIRNKWYKLVRDKRLLTIIASFKAVMRSSHMPHLQLPVPLLLACKTVIQETFPMPSDAIPKKRLPTYTDDFLIALFTIVRMAALSDRKHV